MSKAKKRPVRQEMKFPIKACKDHNGDFWKIVFEAVNKSETTAALARQSPIPKLNEKSRLVFSGGCFIGAEEAQYVAVVRLKHRDLLLIAGTVDDTGIGIDVIERGRFFGELKNLSPTERREARINSKRD